MPRRAEVLLTVPPTVTITSPDGQTEAEFVPGANMVGCSLRHRGDELLIGPRPPRGVQAYAQRGKTMGIPLLHPWANRLARRGYTAAGKTVTLPEPEGRYALDPNGLPIHGALPGHLCWTVDAGSPPDQLIARLAWRTPDLLALFPFEHELVMQATLGAGELTLDVTLQATGADAVPVSFGFHPYLTIPRSARGDWQVSLGASQRLVLDERMIPTGAREPLAHRQFVLGDESWDDGLDGLDERARFSVASEQLTLTMTFEQGFRFAQVYAPPSHDYICFEPMTAPTGALDSGIGLSVVAPGDSYRTRFRLSVTP
ncbi:MAG: aldose 1-epimerase [Solirubrobacteraceae bacterium]